jgi:hypothetical protein
MEEERNQEFCVTEKKVPHYVSACYLIRIGFLKVKKREMFSLKL